MLMRYVHKFLLQSECLRASSQVRSRSAMVADSAERAESQAV